MLVCFGASWPFSIAKSLRTKQVGGKSPVFMSLILLGYACGIAHKLLNPPPASAPALVTHVVWLYAFNLLIVAIDLGLYLKYRAK